MLAIVIRPNSFQSKNTDKMLYTVELSNGDTVFVSDEKEQSLYPMGTTVVINTKKYKGSDGSWKTTKSIIPVKIG